MQSFTKNDFEALAEIERFLKMAGHPGTAYCEILREKMQPHGFTREHVRLLMEDISLYDESNPSAQRVYRAITDLADIIEALLPPEAK